MSEVFQLKHDFRFEAAHRLPHVPEAHKCFRLHGHSFRITVVIEGPLDPKLGWIMDYAVIREHVSPIVQNNLDHRYLNEVEGLENPTSEEIARWLWKRLKSKLPQLSEIIVHETCQTACHYRQE